MKNPSLGTIGQRLNLFFALIRDDREARNELRNLFLGLAVCAVLLYAGVNLFVSPLRSKAGELAAKRRELLAASPPVLGQAYKERSRQLQEEQAKLAEENEILALKKRFLALQWKTWSNPDRFSRIIFTLAPDAPLNMEEHLKALNQMEKRTSEGREVVGINLVGEGSFAELFQYLDYIESKPEVALVTELTVERPPTESYQRTAPVKFSLTVGRYTGVESP